MATATRTTRRTTTTVTSPKAGTRAPRFEPVPFWAKIPHPMSFKEATSVGVDSQDRVYVFNRGPWSMMIFDRDGNYLSTWGQGQFQRPHGIYIDAKDDLFLADDLDHTVRKVSRDGQKTYFVLGTPGKPAPWQGGGIFNRPTHIAISPKSGDVFVTDGYGNSRVHRFTSSGKYVRSWGEPGDLPGQFSLPLNLTILPDGRVVVCDRENFRIQVFDEEGKFLEQWHMHRPIAITSDDRFIYVGEAGAPPVQKGVPNLGLRVSVLDHSGRLVTRFGNPQGGEGPDQFISPHGIALDSRGDIYVAEVSYTAFGSQQNPPREVASLKKWRRVT
ncbi:MAG: peptidylglycine alpha-amidating monooxygenase [Chloroflexi bacterium]|nr:peptidylglycine alpha-amidating monooxygenase [Chloroflexota bacterium]